jgi:long-chain acyl-CoA synthetase
VGRTRTHGETTFLVFDDERASYGAFHRAVVAFAAALSARGVVKGDRVAIVMRNLPEWPVAFYAAASIGAIVAPLNAWWSGAELEHALTDCGAKVCVVDAERLERLQDHLPRCPALEAVYVCRRAAGAGHSTDISMESIIGRPADWPSLPDADLPDVDLGPDDDATLFYTSGTTGKPKGALGDHRSINTNILTAAFVQACAGLRRGDTNLAPARRAVLAAVPLFHVTGCSSGMNPAVWAGDKLVLMRRWDPVRAFELIEREKITNTGGVPTVAWQLIEHPERANYDLSSLKALTYGGAAAAPELVRRIAAVFPGVRPGQGWGMTETGGTATSHVGEDYSQRPDSCGPAVPVVELKVRSLDGARELPVGEVGELWCKGPGMAKGYWNRPDATAETFADGWLRTGDLARLDDEGFCYIVDRAKDMVIRGGENIYSAEVEGVLHEHPAVMEAAVVGVAHRTLGEEPAAVVTLKPGVSAGEAELRAFVGERLAAYKTPVRVLFSSEPLPRTTSGKILKADLKTLFGED